MAKDFATVKGNCKCRHVISGIPHCDFHIDDCEEACCPEMEHPREYEEAQCPTCGSIVAPHEIEDTGGISMSVQVWLLSCGLLVGLGVVIGLCF